MSYAEKLRDPRWQKKRLDVLESAGWECLECGATARELHVHHYWYEPKRLPWEYPDKCFGVLCGSCHSKWHAEKLSIDKTLAGMLPTQVCQARGMLTGLRCMSEDEDFLVDTQVDPLFICGLVRGFWPPSDFQGALLDECLLRRANAVPYLLSDVVLQVIPDVLEYEFVRYWATRVSGKGGSNEA